MIKINILEKKELLRFLVGGGGAVTIDFIVYKILIVCGINRSIAKTISFICGSSLGFGINKIWTFESKAFSTAEIFRYVILYSCTALINVGINQGVIHFIQIELLGFLVATGVSTILNFLGQKYFVFRK